MFESNPTRQERLKLAYPDPRARSYCYRYNNPHKTNRHKPTCSAASKLSHNSNLSTSSTLNATTTTTRPSTLETAFIKQTRFEFEDRIRSPDPQSADADVEKGWGGFDFGFGHGQRAKRNVSASEEGGRSWFELVNAHLK